MIDFSNLNQYRESNQLEVKKAAGGIPKSIWDEALADYPDQIDWIQAFLRSRLDADSDEKQVKRAVDSLLRRGHHYSRIREALNSLSFDTDEFPEE